MERNRNGLPRGSCSYVRRALGREADESIGPICDGSQEASQVIWERREAEDEADPPCGECDACLACGPYADGPPGV